MDVKMTDKIEFWPIDQLQPLDHNPRTHSEEQVSKVANSIVEFGFNNPILVDANRGIIAGHCRLMAAQKLGLKTVPIIELTHLTDEQKRAYIIADNRLALDAGWDIDILAGELAALKDLGFDIDIIGFSDEEIDKLFAPLDGKGLTDDDATPPLPEVPVSVRGDVWVLGRHRVMCGDSTSPEDFERLMSGQLADCVWTDPPYNVNYGEKAEMLDKRQKGHRNTTRILNDNMDSGSFYKFLLAVYTNLFKFSKPGAAIYVAHAESEGINFRKAFIDAGFYLASCLVWKKNALVLGRSDYQWKHEPILYGWNSKGPHRWYGGRNKTTVHEFGDFLFERTGENEWQISLGETSLVIRGENITVEEAHGTVFSEAKPVRNAEHPTMKPVALIERMLLNSTLRDELVLDPFGGSGSTLIACEKRGRAARLMELAPGFCDVIVRRWEEYTGMRAVLEATGQIFAGVERERKA